MAGVWKRLGRASIALVMVAVCTASAIPVSTAQDDASAFRDLAQGSDFRLRVAAALALGRSKSPGARPALERAMANDPHLAVRAAAAAALGTLGDANAAPALRAALDHEAETAVKVQIDGALKKLGSAAPSRQAPAGKAKFLVSLGKIENRSSATGDSLVAAFKSSTRSRLAEVPGVEVMADGDDGTAEGSRRNLPVFTVDGSLTKLDKKQGSDGVSFSARVEYLIRKMPDHTLKGTMAGSAQALAAQSQIRGPSQLSDLQMDAVSGAIDSAFKGAPKALEAATK